MCACRCDIGVCVCLCVSGVLWGLRNESQAAQPQLTSPRPCVISHSFKALTDIQTFEFAKVRKYLIYFAKIGKALPAN